MCFRPANASKGSRICSQCRQMTDNPEVTVCQKCGGELVSLSASSDAAVGRSQAPAPPPGISSGTAPPKAPTLPVQAPPPGLSGGAQLPKKPPAPPNSKKVSD